MASSAASKIRSKLLSSSFDSDFNNRDSSFVALLQSQSILVELINLSRGEIPYGNITEAEKSELSFNATMVLSSKIQNVVDLLLKKQNLETLLSSLDPNKYSQEPDDNTPTRTAYTCRIIKSLICEDSVKTFEDLLVSEQSFAPFAPLCSELDEIKADLLYFIFSLSSPCFLRFQSGLFVIFLKTIFEEMCEVSRSKCSVSLYKIFRSVRSANFLLKKLSESQILIPFPVDSIPKFFVFRSTCSIELACGHLQLNCILYLASTNRLIRRTSEKSGVFMSKDNLKSVYTFLTSVAAVEFPSQEKRQVARAARERVSSISEPKLSLTAVISDGLRLVSLVLSKSENGFFFSSIEKIESVRFSFFQLFSTCEIFLRCIDRPMDILHCKIFKILNDSFDSLPGHGLDSNVLERLRAIQQLCAHNQAAFSRKLAGDFEQNLRRFLPNDKS